jgi:5-methylcytosine-specific restriction endonuclease McrA
MVRRKPLTRRTPLRSRRRRLPVKPSGFCVAALPGCHGRAVHVHHRKPRGRGGSDAAANLAALCASCHRWIHEHPAAANARGWLLHSWETEA